MKRNILAISTGVISTFVLGTFLTSHLSIPNHLTGEGNGFMSYPAWLTYFICSNRWDLSLKSLLLLPQYYAGELTVSVEQPTEANETPDGVEVRVSSTILCFLPPA